MKTTFQEGDWVWNRKQGIGKIEDCSNEEILVAYDSGEDEIFELGPKKTVPLFALVPEGFWLQKKNSPEQLSETIKENPIEVLLLMVKDGVTDITAAQVKAAVMPELVSKEDADQWVGTLLEKLEMDARFEVDKNKKIVYRGDMVEIAGDMLMKFRKAPSLKEKQKICREMLKLEEKGVPVEDMKESAISFFSGTAANRTNKMGARLEALFFLNVLDEDQFEYVKEPLFEEIENMNSERAAEAVAEITDSQIRGKLFEIMKEKKADEFFDISIQLSKRFKKQQRDWVLDYLLKEEDRSTIKAIVEKTMGEISTNLQPFVWLIKATLANPKKIEELGYKTSIIIPSMFRIFSNIYVTSAFSVRPKDDRSVSREEDEILKMLVNHKKVISFLKKIPEKEAASFAVMYRDCNALPNETRENFIDDLFPKTFPDIEIADAEEHEDDENILTREAFEKYQQELKDIVDFKLDQATKDIQTAREWGDISENAELNIAQEDQRKLIIRKNQLERMLDNCRIIDN